MARLALGRSVALFAVPALVAWASMAEAAVTLTETVAPTFGLLLSGPGGRQFILNTNDSVTGANASDYLSGAAAGQFAVGDDLSPSSLVIVAENIGASGGLVVGDVTCSYNGGAPASCDGAGIAVTSSTSGTLELGMEISTSQVHVGGDSAVISIDVSVAYQ